MIVVRGQGARTALRAPCPPSGASMTEALEQRHAGHGNAQGKGNQQDRRLHHSGADGGHPAHGRGQRGADIAEERGQSGSFYR